jgi:multidrug resistance efflux pump
MKYTTPLLAAMTLVSLTAIRAEAQPATTNNNQIRIRHCVVSIVHEAQVPAEEGGVIRGLPVKEGDEIKQGELLAQIDDTEAQLRRDYAEFEYASAQKEASNDVNVRAARKTKEVAEAEHDEGVEINRKSPGSVSQSELRRLLLTAERSGLQIEVAEMEQDVAKLTEQSKAKQMELANAAIDKLKITSPIDGVVVQKYRHLGEWVQPGEPVMHVVDMQNLRVEGFVDASQYSPQDIKGKKVTIEVSLAGGRIATYAATLNFVSPIVEASGDYRVWADVVNQQEQDFWQLQPGLPADMVVEMN